MAESFHVVVNIPDRSYHALAKVEIKEMAVAAGFTGHRLGELEIIISEIISNLTKHTHNGGMILCRKLDGLSKGLELIAIDDGPGITSLQKILNDGFSTTNTLGQGLGAIRRLSNEFDMYSQKGWGTILLSKSYIEKKEPDVKTGNLKMSTLRVCKSGEKACGDNWACFYHNKQYRLALMDGLGHGENASIAATQAVRSMEVNIASPPNELLRRIDADIKKTRGVVMTAVYIDPYNKQLVYCGVGNISAKLVGAAAINAGRTFSPYNGIIGHTVPNTLNNSFIPWNSKSDILVMHSDGLTGRWDLAKYHNILKHDTMILCAALYKDHNRGTDDTTVSIIRFEK